ncbi:hypothetical protein L249_7418 [Ophiocordyceps polyrhachis-furcata BCC 54312]|uniref:Uncharacterized protein n=1 Tax=Ophiocordyceps polyrhachis-furcata BCC 54312 TaxID=1330021 RepID=A0A367LAZ2_9HYPO|nr:hypothetical protein L249_7418 [Ophiocordyceps polyrhachis-furcata BCC 54312]
MGVLQVGTLKYLEKIISISFSHLLNTNTSPASNSSSIASFRLLLEIIMSNQGVDHVIEKKKTNHVMVVFNKVEADNKLEVVLYYSIITWLYVTPFLRPSRSGAMTAISTARRSLIARRSMYSAPIAVTIAVTSRSGAMTAIAPL